MALADRIVRLAVASGAAFLLILFLHSLYFPAGRNAGHPSRDERDQYGYNARQDGDGNDAKDHFGWAQRLLNSESSAAQWITAVSSLAAALVSGFAAFWVKRTYNVTLKMTTDAREIGEAQARAYIYAINADINIGGNTIDVQFKNFGMSPGSVSFVSCAVHVSDPYSGELIWSQTFWSDGFTVTPGEVHTERFRLDRGRAEYVHRVTNEQGIRTEVQGNFQSVDVFKKVHSHPLHIVLADGILRQ